MLAIIAMSFVALTFAILCTVFLTNPWKLIPAKKGHFFPYFSINIGPKITNSTKNREN